MICLPRHVIYLGEKPLVSLCIPVHLFPNAYNFNLLSLLTLKCEPYFYFPCHHIFQTQFALILVTSNASKSDDLQSFIGDQGKFCISMCRHLSTLRSFTLRENCFFYKPLHFGVQYLPCWGELVCRIAGDPVCEFDRALQLIWIYNMFIVCWTSMQSRSAYRHTIVSKVDIYDQRELSIRMCILIKEWLRYLFVLMYFTISCEFFILPLLLEILAINYC